MLEDLIFTGKDVDEALEKASRELDMQPDFLDYEILQEAKKPILGFLGGREVKIRIKNLPPEIRRERQEAAEEEQPRKTKEEKRRAEPAKKGRPAKKEKSPPAKKKQRPGKDEKEKPVKTGDFNDAAVDTVKSLTENMGLKLKIRVVSSKSRTLVLDLVGEDRRYLLAKDGQGLNDLQYLLNLMLFDYSDSRKKIHLDSEGFRRKRERELVEIAKKAADRVRASGSEKKLGPMNPYERRIVHLTLNDEKKVTTYSVGRGFIKKVIITPVKDEKRRSSSNR